MAFFSRFPRGGLAVVNSAVRLDHETESKLRGCGVSCVVMGIDDRLTQEIVERVLRVAKPDRIILFGSAATGRMTRDSDVDLLVVERAPWDSREERSRIAELLGDLEFPVDVFVIATERFEESKNIFGGIAYPAHKYGRVIYEAT
jgi:predicted nucleotidyltransferase